MPETRWQRLRVGEQLPPLKIDVTAKLIVGAAIASRDFQDIHHDKAAAQATGVADIFMNILTTNGLVGRYVTDWAGPGARLKSMAIRLGVPNFPGDQLLLSGSVAALDAKSGRVELQLSGHNSRGEHVSGTVTVVPAT